MNNATYLLDQLVKSGLTVSVISERTGISRAAILKILDGKTRDVRFSTFSKILNFYCKINFME